MNGSSGHNKMELTTCKSQVWASTIHNVSAFTIGNTLTETWRGSLLSIDNLIFYVFCADSSPSYVNSISV